MDDKMKEHDVFIHSGYLQSTVITHTPTPYQ